MAWSSMTIYVVEFLHRGVRKHMQGYHQMENMEAARRDWLAKNTAPVDPWLPTEFETQTTAVYVTDV